MLFILTSVWLSGTPNAGQNFIFPYFSHVLQDFDVKITKRRQTEQIFANRSSKSCIQEHAKTWKEIISTRVWRVPNHWLKSLTLIKPCLVKIHLAFRSCEFGCHVDKPKMKSKFFVS